MAVTIESGKNWKVQKAKNQDFGKTLCCKNETLQVDIFVEDKGLVIKIPVPSTVDPSHAKAQGIFLSKLKDEEGFEPQLFINVPEDAWLSLFDEKSEDHLKIKNEKG